MHARNPEASTRATERAAAFPPPIEIDTLVPCAPAAAFQYFTRDIGWEQLGDNASEAREAYANGWPTVLGRLYNGYCEQAAATASR